MPVGRRRGSFAWRETVSAMPKETVDWREVFNAEVRAIQAQYPRAHEALRNWGLWSRERGGIFPTLAKPGWTEFYTAGRDEVTEENTPELEIVIQIEIKAEGPELPHSDERQGEEIDIRVHALRFPTIWRRVLKAAYVTVEIPEYECPRQAGVGHQGYLVFLDGALAFLERALA